MAYYTDDDVDPPRRNLGRGWITWLVVATVGIAGWLLAASPSPYVVEYPGPVFDTLGTVEIEGETLPLIDIPTADTYPTTGSLDMLTVSSIGNPGRGATWGIVVGAWLDKTQAVVDLDTVYPNGQTTEQSSEQAQQMMVQSQQNSIAAALSALGKDYDTTVTVLAASAGGPSDGLLVAGDVIAAVNSTRVTGPVALRQLLEDNGVERAATISVVREGVAQDVAVTPLLSDGETPSPIIGVEIGTTFVFPLDIAIQLVDVGGPSAGQMFALAIVDKLTPGSLTGGAMVAGTGTISESGLIGPIGGIRQKMYGAVRAGADYFLAPASNCDEVVGHIPDGLSVFAVDSLGDSLTALNTIATGASTATLTKCPRE